MDISQMEKDELLQQAETLRAMYFDWAGRPDSHPLALEADGHPLKGLVLAARGALELALGSRDQALVLWELCISNGENVPWNQEYIVQVLSQHCPTCELPKLVVSDEYHDGFAGGTTAIFHLECGHKVVDESDDVAAAR